MPDHKKTRASKKTATPVAPRKPAAPARSAKRPSPRKKPAATAARAPAAKPAAGAAKAAPPAPAKGPAKAATRSAEVAARRRAVKEASAQAPEPAAKASPARVRAPKAAARAAPAKVGTRAKPRPRAGEPVAPDPEGFFVARVRGEDGLRDAPHQLLEGPEWEEEAPPAAFDEGLGDLPWAYGDDTLVALPRDPRTLFLYWDHARETLQRAFEGLDRAHAQLWLFARGAGWERIRVIDFALESRGYYVHDLEPGRVYRAEIHLVDRGGRERLLPQASNPVTLPPSGPSQVVDDRFVRIPWEFPLPRLLGPGAPGGPFSEELRALLARLSDWNSWRTAAGQAGAGGRDPRPTSPAGGPGGPGSPTSPFGPFGQGGR